MGTKGHYWGAAIVVGLTFAAGFFAGFKFKEWRIRYLTDKRDKLLKKLQDTQRQIENASPLVA